MRQHRSVDMLLVLRRMAAWDHVLLMKVLSGDGHPLEQGEVKVDESGLDWWND